MKLLLPVAVISISFTAPAFAYLDPGTGSMILQAIVGGVAVAGTALGVYWNKVRAVAGRFLGAKAPRP